MTDEFEHDRLALALRMAKRALTLVEDAERLVVNGGDWRMMAAEFATSALASLADDIEGGVQYDDKGSEQGVRHEG